MPEIYQEGDVSDGPSKQRKQSNREVTTKANNVFAISIHTEG